MRLLSEVQFEVVKIDLSLVQRGAAHNPSHAILRALQGLAAQWNASVVAEGIETAEQLAIVRSLGISAGQGYLLGRPGPEPTADAIDLARLAAGDQVQPPSLIDRLLSGRGSGAPLSQGS